jgi:hypothetical protein
MNNQKLQELIEDSKIKRIFKDIEMEKSQDKLKDITTSELIDELIFRLNIPIFGLCNLCCLKEKEMCYFDLKKHSEKIGNEIFCKKCTIEIS